MTSFSPKDQFIRHGGDSVEELKKHREAYWMTTAFAYSLAQMAHNGATAEMLNGARIFISTVQNLWESATPATTLPVKTLSSDNPNQSTELKK